MKRSSQYFVGPAIDTFFVGGLSIAFYLIAYTWMYEHPPSWIYSLSALLFWFGNWPHFAATNYRLYHSRENIRQYPLTALAVPPLIIAGVVASLMHPDTIAPFFVKVFLVWSPYHFSGQTVGVTMIYARRAGFNIDPITRRALTSFVFGSYLVNLVAQESSTTFSTYYGIQVPGFGIPLGLYDVFQVIMYAGGALFLLGYIRQSRQRKQLLPLIILLAPLTQYVWFVLGSRIAGYNEFVPFFHSIQYLLVAWSMQLVERAEREKQLGNPAFFWTESARWFGLNIVIGALLFAALPELVARAGNPTELSMGIVLAAVQLHHFFVDGVIWKLRRATVSQPLMVNLLDSFSPQRTT